MPIKVEAALVTQKRPHAQFNSDSVNINGKVLSRDIILNGYKGSGTMSGSVYFALTSSPVEGFADAAVAAFNDRASDFSEQAQEPENVIKEYYDNCSAALEDMNHSGDELAAAVLFASGRKVILASSGETKLYSVNEENFRTLEPESGTEEYGIISFPDVSEGDMFILAGPGISDVMSDKDVHDICKIADGSVKKTVSLISKVALAKPGVKAASVIAVRIAEISLDTDKVEAGFVPDLSVFEDKNKDNVSDENSDEIKIDAEVFTEKADTEDKMSDEKEPDEKSSEQLSDTVKEDAEIIAEITEQLNIYDEDIKHETENIDKETEIGKDVFAEAGENKKSKKYVPVIITVIAAIAVFLAAFFIVKGINDKTGLPEETTDEFETIVENESESSEEKEETTSEETATQEETTEESTTKKTPAWIPQRPERPTSPKVTTTTAAAETTTASQQTTSPAGNSETTTDASTTAAAETTTVPAETTDVSTTAAAETTAAEVTTAAVPQENSSTAAAESSEPGTAAE